MQNLKQKAIYGSVAGIVAILLAGCDGKNKAPNADDPQNSFYYSNPTASAISFKIDGQNYRLASGERGKVTLLPGMHTLENSDGQHMPFMLFKDNKGGILNPNHYMYYLLSESYSPPGVGERENTVAANDKVMINGHVLTMPLPVQSTNAVFIDGNLFNCNYPLGTAFPNKLSGSNKKDKARVKVKTKCFDKPEVIQYLASDYQLDVSQVAGDSDNKDSVTLNFAYNLPVPAFTDAKVQEKAEKLNKMAQTIIQSRDPNIHDQLNNQMYPAMKDFTDTALHAIVKENKADQPRLMQAYEAYTGQISRLLVYGLLPRPAEKE